MGILIIEEPPIPTATPDEQLKLEINQHLKSNENAIAMPSKQPKKTLLDLLLIPIKKIAGSDHEKE